MARSIQVLLMDLHFTVIEKHVFPVTKEMTPNRVISQVIERVWHMMKGHQLKEADLIGIGVGAIGPLDRKKGCMIHPESFRTFGWEEVPVVEPLQRVFNVPIVLNNGANTAAIAEYRIQDYTNQNLLYCISGYGIRCGIIQSGTPLNSKKGDASSYGHMIVLPGGRTCTCGRKGCLNAYSSYGAMFEQIEQIDSTLVFTSSEEMIDALNNSDPAVVSVVNEAAYFQGLAIANMVNILHPDVVLLQGNIIEKSDSYVKKVIEVAKEHIYSNHLKSLYIGKGQLGREAVAIGAAIELFQHFLRRCKRE
nr:ROK family protein [Bacillus sp. JCM 19034]